MRIIVVAGFSVVYWVLFAMVAFSIIAADYRLPSDEPSAFERNLTTGIVIVSGIGIYVLILFLVRRFIKWADQLPAPLLSMTGGD